MDNHQISGFGWQAEVSDLGAELQSLTNPAGDNILWHGDGAFWSGRSPILFPIVGRAAEDRLTLAEQPIQMAQHGFARRQTFTVIERGDSFIRHELRPNDQTRAQYPRDFRLRLDHRLSEAGLTITAEVENTDPQPLPFGIGFHPAFRFPLPQAEGQPHYIRLNNGATPARTPLEDGLLSRQTIKSPFSNGELKISHDLFVDDALIFLQGAGTGLTFGPPQGPKLAVRFENLPFVALWTKGDAPFLCIEPWHGAAAWADGGPAIEDRPGTMHLEPGQSARFALHVGMTP